MRYEIYERSKDTGNYFLLIQKHYMPETPRVSDLIDINNNIFIVEYIMHETELNKVIIGVRSNTYKTHDREVQAKLHDINCNTCINACADNCFECGSHGLFIHYSNV